MAVHIKQRETQGNEVLTSEVITPGAATLYPCLSHPSTFGSFFCFHPYELVQQYVNGRSLESTRPMKNVLLSQACVWEWRQLCGYFAVLLMMRGLKAASVGWIHVSWIDLRKEEHPRQISRPVLPAKTSGGEILSGRVEFQIKEWALRLQVSPIWCSLRVMFGWECYAFPSRQVHKSPCGSCGLLWWGLSGETS